MAGSMDLYGQIVGVASDALGALSSYYEDEHQDEYATRKNSWQRAMDSIENENRRREESVRNRNQVISQMGGGWESRAPTMKAYPVRLAEYSPSATAENLQTGSDILGYVSDMASNSGLGGGGEETDTTKLFSADVNTSAPEQVDYNSLPTGDVDTGSSDSRYAYSDRYNPSRQYLTRGA